MTNTPLRDRSLCWHDKHTSILLIYGFKPVLLVNDSIMQINLYFYFILKTSYFRTKNYTHFHSLLITGFATCVPQRVILVEQELFTLPEHLISPRGFLSLVSGIMLFLPLFLFFCHCIICPPSIYDVMSSLWWDFVEERLRLVMLSAIIVWLLILNNTIPG